MSKVLFVCSGGGHLAELLELRAAFDASEKVLVTYEGKNNDVAGAFDRHYRLPHFLKNPVRAAFMPLRCLAILLRERPETIVSTGAEVAIPFFYLGKLLFRSDLIFVETVSRIRHPSITGRVVYPVADLFLVQWPELCAAYGRRARYVGGLL